MAETLNDAISQEKNCQGAIRQHPEDAYRSKLHQSDL